jgi:hypothetical protein
VPAPAAGARFDRRRERLGGALARREHVLTVRRRIDVDDGDPGHLPGHDSHVGVRPAPPPAEHLADAGAVVRESLPCQPGVLPW